MIEIDKDRFKKIFRKVFNAYAKRQGVFAEFEADNAGPQKLSLPSAVTRGDKNHLYWLALVAFTDKRTNSATLYPCFAGMFDRNPKLFQRGYYPSVSKMTKLFRQYTIAVPVKEIAFFLERKKHIDLYFDGDPVKIFEGVTNVDELMKKLEGIKKTYRLENILPGAKEKMLCLWAMFVKELVPLEFADVIPIDVWVQSICSSVGVLRGSGNIKFSALERLLRPLMQELIYEFRYVEGVTNATWILGKKLCTHCSRKDMRILCPIYDLCEGPFKRMRHPVSNKHYGAIEVPSQFIPKNSVRKHLNPY